MTILFCGSHLSDFEGTSGLYMTTSTAQAYFDTLYQQAGMLGYMEDRATPAFAKLPSVPTGDLWVHYRLYVDSSYVSAAALDGGIMSFYNETGQRLAYLRFVNGLMFAYAQGDTTVTSVASLDWSSKIRAVTFIDVKLTVTPSAITVTYYDNGSLIATATASNTTGLKAHAIRVLFENNDLSYGVSGTYGNCGFGEVIITDNEPTLNWRLASLRPSAAGNYTQWGGDYTSVLNTMDGAFLTAASTGIRESWQVEDYAGPTTGVTVRGVYMNIRGNTGATGPQSVAPFVRIGSVDYELTAKALTGIFEPVTFEWPLNPDTGVAWVPANLVDMEFGVRSVA